MINLSKIPDEPPTSNLRRLFVSKSNSIIPNELQVRMGNSGNEYRDPTVQQNSNQNRNALWYIGSYLSTGKKLKEIVLHDAKLAGYEDDMVQSAVAQLANEVAVDGKTYLRVK